MFNILATTIRLSDTQRAFLFKDGRFERVLESGKHRVWHQGSKIDVEQYDITDSQGIALDERLRHIISLYPQAFAKHLKMIETNEQQMALVYQRGLLQTVLPPKTATAFWQVKADMDIQIIDLNHAGRLPDEVAALLHEGNHQALLPLANAIQHFVVADHERALVYKDKQFVEVLASGQYSYWDQARTLKVEKINITDPLSIQANAVLLELVALHPKAFADFVIPWETADNEVGLVYEKQTLRDVIAPNEHGVYWCAARPITIRKQAIDTDDQPIESALARQLAKPRSALLQQTVRDMVYYTEIADKHIGFLLINGKVQRMLEAGAYAWWTFNHHIRVMQMDMRLQHMDVNGQEILTKDRVSLRVNLAASWQVNDAEKVMLELADHNGYLYNELQLALRAVVGTRTLDELLEDKKLLNQDLLTLVYEKISALGLEVKTIGVKDIILPGEMKDILAQVVEAQKIAEANLIRRREETQATRSLHNTAKVMEGNPTLLRLKEMEVLEKITGRINNLNVYGGLDGVMKDMVKLG